MNSNKIKGNIFLLMTAMIWGFAFVAQRTVMVYMPPFLYSGIRMYVGTVSLIVIIIIANKVSIAKELAVEKKVRRKQTKELLYSGMACGIAMFFAANLQQIGLIFTTASKTAFITTLYIVLVPIMGVFMKHQITRNSWIGVLLSVIGLYLLCITDSFTIALGDVFVLLSAIFWGIQILFMNYFVQKLMVAKVVAAQFFVAGTMSFMLSPVIDSYFNIHIDAENFVDALPSILYVGVISTAIAATFQGIGQKYVKPTTASIILSTESVFGAICGCVFMKDMLSIREIFGCIFMFIAVLIAQKQHRPN